MFITDINISPYKLKEGERDSNEFVYSQDSKGYCYIPKDYNGVADVFYNHISLLGNKENIDTIKTSFFFSIYGWEKLLKKRERKTNLKFTSQ